LAFTSQYLIHFSDFELEQLYFL